MEKIDKDLLLRSSTSKPLFWFRCYSSRIQYWSVPCYERRVEIEMSDCRRHGSGTGIIAKQGWSVGSLAVLGTRTKHCTLCRLTASPGSSRRDDTLASTRTVRDDVAPRELYAGATVFPPSLQARRTWCIIF